MVRRPHTKSHFGCANCRRRKVKCDETTPICLNCLRRREQCSFLEVTAPQTPNFLEPSKNSSGRVRSRSLVSHRSPDGSETSGRTSGALLEIELTHFFLVETLRTMLWSESRRDIWSRSLFPYGFVRSELLDAHLATAAMHKVSQSVDGDSELQYIQFASEKQSSVLSEFIPMLSHPSAETAQSLFAISGLVPVWCYASRSLPAQLNIISRLPFESPSARDHYVGHDYVSDLISIMKIARGVNAIIAQCGPWLCEQGLGPFFTPGGHPMLPSRGTAGLDDLLQRIRQSAMEEPIVDLYAAEIERTKHYLERMVGDENKEVVLGWPTNAPQWLAVDLAQRKPAALVMLSHWAACFHELDDQWWAKGWGSGLIYEVHHLLDPSWRHYLDWPLSRVSNPAGDRMMDV